MVQNIRYRTYARDAVQQTLCLTRDQLYCNFLLISSENHSNQVKQTTRKYRQNKMRRDIDNIHIGFYSKYIEIQIDHYSLLIGERKKKSLYSAENTYSGKLTKPTPSSRRKDGSEQEVCLSLSDMNSVQHEQCSQSRGTVQVHSWLE